MRRWREDYLVGRHLSRIGADVRPDQPGRQELEGH